MRVEFMNEEAEFNKMDDVDDFSDSDLVYHVRDALKSVSMGDTDKYNQLVAVMYYRASLGPDKIAMLVTSLKALSGAVMYLDNALHNSLLASIFSMSLWNCGPDVMDALLELIISLATSRGEFFYSCLEMLVNNFTPPPSFINMLNQLCGNARKDQVLSRVHSALENIANLVPFYTPKMLKEIVIKKQPHYRNSQEKVLSMYVENMLRLEGSAFGEFVRSIVLSWVVDLLLELDVQIFLDDSAKGIFKMELEDVEETIDDEGKGCNELCRELSQESLGGNQFAEKLDSLMVLIFEHLDACEVSGRLIEVFEALLQSFQKTIFPADKPKFSQFVMFYACALDPEHCGTKFSTMLTDIFVSHDNALTSRMNAVAYLASYLSRGKFLSTSLVIDTLKRLVDWCLDYCAMQKGNIDPKAHTIFYSGCQAIMYVLCFRMRSMMTIPRFKLQLFALPIDMILSHDLSPLKVCLPYVVNEFLLQAKAARLFEKYDFDNYLHSELSTAFDGAENLNMFFPFDPYLLKKSDRFIRPNFVYWSMVKPTYDDDDDGDDDNECSSDEVFAEARPTYDDEDKKCSSNEEFAEAFEDENAASMMNNVMSRNVEEDLDLDEFDSALNKMSITHKFQFGGELRDPVRMPSRIRPSTSPESL